MTCAELKPLLSPYLDGRVDGKTMRQIREHLEGNFCRCTGYQNIVKAVEQGARAMGLQA